MSATTEAPADVVARAVPAIDREAAAATMGRDDKRPTPKQQVYIARLAVELLGEAWPASTREASVLIGKLMAAKDAAATASAAFEAGF